jgi:hypothetical protein
MDSLDFCAGLIRILRRIPADCLMHTGPGGQTRGLLIRALRM